MAVDRRKSRHRSVPETSPNGIGSATANRKGLGALFVERAAVASLLCLAGIYLVGAVDIAGQARQLGIDFPMMFSYFSIDEILTRGISRVLNPVAIVLFAAVAGLLFFAGEGTKRGFSSMANSGGKTLRIWALILSLLFLASVLVVGASTEVVLSAVTFAALVGVWIMAPVLGVEIGPRGLVALGAIVIGGWFLVTSWISPSLGALVMFVERGDPAPVATAGLVINHGDGNWYIWKPSTSEVTAIPDRQVLEASAYSASVRDDYFAVANVTFEVTASDDLAGVQWVNARFAHPGELPTSGDRKSPDVQNLIVAPTEVDMRPVFYELQIRLTSDCVSLLKKFTENDRKSSDDHWSQCSEVVAPLISFKP